MNLTKRSKNILTILAVGAAIWLSGYILIGKTFVPQSFKDARVRAATVAEELVSLLNESIKNLDKIAELDRKYQFNLASEMVGQELQRSTAINSKAIELSNEFSTMGEYLGTVAPVKARNLASEAIKDELKLIGEIIEYNSSMNGLMQALKFKFSGDIRYDADDIQKTASSMNMIAKEINSLNSAYNQKMEEFDNLTK